MFSVREVEHTMTARPSAEFPKFPATISSSLNISAGVPSTPPEPERDKDSTSKENLGNIFTLFVGNIAENVSNKCMEKILKQCGFIERWKRIQGTDGKYQTFGFCDFQDESSTLCALRVLNGFELYEKKLVVKAEDELLKRLSTWAAQYHKETGNPVLPANGSGSLPNDEEGKKGDEEKLKKIKLIVAKNQQEPLEDKKNKPKSSKKKKRSRSSSSSSSSTSSGYERYELKQVYKKKRARYEESVRYWESREKKQAHYYGKLEKDMKKLNSKRNEAEKLLKFLATYDDKIDDDEWYSGYEYKQRRKYHEREKRKDEEDRIAELAEIDMHTKMADELTASSKLVEDASNSKEPISAVIKTEPVQWTIADSNETVHENDTKPFNPITNVLGSGPQSITQKLINVFGNIEEEDVDELRTRKRLKPFEISKEERLAHMTSEEKKKKFKELLHNLPKHKDELFAISVDRSQIDDAWIEKRVRPWVMKRILEFIGEEEKSFCDFICDKIAKESDPHKILNDIKMILDEDAEVFMIKLWRLIIFETEAKKYGLPLAH